MCASGKTTTTTLCQNGGGLRPTMGVTTNYLKHM